ncbi:hypothetical protein F5Y17DRAFT_22848 [Xylariaceae sp. FL0594]|nr:hypothetical protein F5Y17DRAFT_22848 [Xylariaceae sp. FL0594]
MRALIIGQVIRANHNGFCMKHIRFQSTLSQRLSITAFPTTSKKQVLEELSRHAINAKGQWSHGAQDTDGLAVLASKEFAGWLEDADFMSTFLKTLLKSESATPADGSSLNILSGVTDGISSSDMSHDPRPGISVLRGRTDTILPGLWAEGDFENVTTDSVSAVSFATNPLARNTGTLKVTLPLANTVFQNGRRSTLFASRWDVGNDGSLNLRTRGAKAMQQINSIGHSVNHTSSTIPLLPLTPPRKIVASLGNIIRQIEVGGSATPASQELEAIIPKIFEERARHSPSATPKPIGVWCWVIPPRVVESTDFERLKLFQAGSSETEADIVSSSTELFSELLSSGCRLHKILSGGGGWGLKQGLLSLDPETTFSLPGQDDDIEMFIKSFEERNDAEQTGGLATQGSYLLFCVEPQTPISESAQSRSPDYTPSFTLGVAPNADHSSSHASYSGPVEIIDGHFGASSAAGLFLGATRQSQGMSGTARAILSTKVDVPGAYFSF